MPATSIFSLLLEYDVSQLSVEFAEGRYVNVSFKATAGNSIPGLIHAHVINTKPK